MIYVIKARLMLWCWPDSRSTGKPLQKQRMLSTGTCKPGISVIWISVSFSHFGTKHNKTYKTPTIPIGPLRLDGAYHLFAKALRTVYIRDAILSWAARVANWLAVMLIKMCSWLRNIRENSTLQSALKHVFLAHQIETGGTCCWFFEQRTQAEWSSQPRWTWKTKRKITNWTIDLSAETVRMTQARVQLIESRPWYKRSE